VNEQDHMLVAAKAVLYEHDQHRISRGNALGHCHAVPPFWDKDGRVCGWCVAVAELRRAVEAVDQ
jgi:hypothetical protein